jgi:hypothetical protein
MAYTGPHISHRKFTPEQDVEIAELRRGGMTVAALARQYECSLPAMRGSLKRSGLGGPPGRPKSAKRPLPKLGPGRAWGERHGSWKGGRVITADGYIWLRVQPDTPFKEMAYASGYVPEHRLVMAISLGRALTENETVHHKDDDRSNNTIENLQLRHGNHGNGIALRCIDCGSVNIEAVDLT